MMLRCLSQIVIIVWISTSAAVGQAPSRLLGTWEVKKDLSTTGISGLTQGEVDSMIDARVIYRDACAVSGRDSLRSPGYETRVLSAQEFYDYGHCRLTELDISKSSVTMITLTGANYRPSPFFGATVFLKRKTIVVGSFPTRLLTT